MKNNQNVVRGFSSILVYVLVGVVVALIVIGFYRRIHPKSGGGTLLQNPATYSNIKYGYVMDYPSDFTVKNETTEGVSLLIPTSYYVPDTTISDSVVETATTNDDCSKMDELNAYQSAGIQAVKNGIPFVAHESADAGAGNFYYITEYNTPKNNLCYRIKMIVHEHNPGVVYNDQAQIATATTHNEETLKKLIPVIDQIVSTFKFTK